MKRIFLKRSKKVTSLMLMALLVFFTTSMDVWAMEEKKVIDYTVDDLPMFPVETIIKGEQDNSSIRTMLYNCTINVHSSSSGLRVMFETDSVQNSSVIGVKDIKIKQKVWYGWKTVATSTGGSDTDSTSYMGTILFSNAIKDETYRISCVHYADADVYTELDNEVEIIFTY